MHRDFPNLGRDELFSRLAAGHAAGVTVLTPNRRLSQALHRDFDLAQAAGGLQSWETADILPFDAFVQRAWEDALYSPLATQMPILMTPAQEQAVWEDSLRDSRHGDSLLSTPAAAAQCREAWDLVHGWQLYAKLAQHEMGEDARAFVEWMGRYERLCRERRLLDKARLPEAVARLVSNDAVRKPAAAVMYGFDLLAPRQRAFLEALQAQGVQLNACSHDRHAAAVFRLEFAKPEQELESASRWARSRLEADPTARIGIVVPDLAQSRARVVRSLSRILHPDFLLPDATGRVPAFNISLGTPLDGYPLVKDALLLLRLCGRDVPFEEASRIVRSPFVGGAESEMEVRARLDAALRGRAGLTISLEALLRLAGIVGMPRAAILAERLSRLAEHRKSALFGSKPAGEWARAFSDALRVAGFPGERTLDSNEFQALDKWHELLAAFAALDRVTGRMGHAEACARLERLAREELFQPETAAVPIQVLGILESAGLDFDHLWVMGLTDEAWPMPARPNPFVPVAMQRQAGVPHADALSSLELDRRITAGWLGAATQVVVSHARMKGDSEVLASPLIAALPLSGIEDLEADAWPTLRDAMAGAGQLERLDDPRGTPLQSGPRPGGTGLFRDQAACPFRAFARHRLASEGLEFPQAGLDSRDRGTLLHEMLRAVWESIETKSRLDVLAGAPFDELLGDCADEAIARVRRRRPEVLTGRFAAIERERLVKLARAWLEVERARGDFEVLATEEKRPMTFGGVTVNVKLDRMDQLAQGGRAVLDYKTGSAAVASWLGPRPEEPQLPMYALASGEDVRAIAFARLRPGELDFCGVAVEEGLLPGVKTIEKNKSPLARGYKDWGELRAGWERELNALGEAFLAGDARVAPKRGSQTCQQCDQQMLCRIAEKSPDSLGVEAGPSGEAQ